MSLGFAVDGVLKGLYERLELPDAGLQGFQLDGVVRVLRIWRRDRSHGRAADLSDPR